MGRSMRDLMRFVKDADLTMGQYTTLIRLHYGDRCGISEIASHLGITNPAASQLIDRLVQMGLIERVEDPTDRRAKQLSLTPKSRTLLQASFEARLGWLNDLADTIPSEHRPEATAALGHLIQAAQTLEPQLVEAINRKFTPH